MTRREHIVRCTELQVKGMTCHSCELHLERRLRSVCGVVEVEAHARSRTVRAGLPVRWTINGDGARGCTSILVVPDLHIVKPLSAGTNVVEFTAPFTPGRLAFSCSMGMAHSTINVL